MRIYLIGFMGSGKSTLGRTAAMHYQVPFFETDVEIERKEEMSIADIFNDQGEFYFRSMENQILTATLSVEKSIVATGGGLPCHDDNMNWILQHGISIYLEWSFDTLKSRLLNHDPSRPMLANFPPGQKEKEIESLFALRLPFYEQAAVTIEMSGDMAKDEATLIKACKYIW